MKHMLLTGLMMAAVALSTTAPVSETNKARLSTTFPEAREPAPYIKNIGPVSSGKNQKTLPSKSPKIFEITESTEVNQEQVVTVQQKRVDSPTPLSSLLGGLHTASKKSETTPPPDTTPPTPPSNLTASATLLNLQASWTASKDPKSGVVKYVYGIGTNSTGDYNSLPNVRWWRVVYDTHVTTSITLDPQQTYYVSVYAVNGAGIKSSIVTSGPIHPGWTNLGAEGNTITLQFAPTGVDANGKPTSGWTPAQIATMSSFFEKMYPILEDLYGPPAISSTITVVRDLRYHNSNIFLPTTDEIRKDDTFNPQLFAHELVHAFRNDYILSSNQNWTYDPTLSSFEEGFAQAVSYDAMNKYVELYPKDPIVPGNGLWGSNNDWDYDYQNMPELRGTDFWSDGGGTGLYFLRYEMAAAAIKKIQIESPQFYKQFNQEYYQRINKQPTTVRPTRPLILSIVASIVPTIEGQSVYEWFAKQHIFYSQNVYGQKIFHDIQDYPYLQFFAFDKIYFLNTMSCGSEWACWNGKEWVYHRLNGAQGQGRLTDIDGRTVWSGNLLIEPTQNPQDGVFVFGTEIKNLTTATTTTPWPGGDPSNFILDLNTFGLYKFTTSFTDPVTSARTTNSVYRVFGSQLADSRGVWGGVLNHRNGTIYLDHEDFPKEPGIPVVNGAFAGSRLWAGIPNPRTGGFDTVPGKVTVRFVDSNTNQTFYAQRNIHYGSQFGNQMFLFDFPISQGGYGGSNNHGTTNPLPDQQ